MSDTLPPSPPREIPANWKIAHDLLRRALDSPYGTSERDHSIARAHQHFATCGDPRLAKLAHLLTPGMSDPEILVALVPIERAASRTFLADEDLGITTTDTAAPRTPSLPMIVVADNLRSAFNIGALFRSIDAIGLEALWLCGYSATPEHPAVQRAALGADTSVPWRSFPNIRDAIALLRSQGRTLYALETAQNAIPIQNAAIHFPSALLLGSERFGLDPEIVQAADATLCLQTYGIKNSLNVANAFTAAAYAIRWKANSDIH